MVIHTTEVRIKLEGLKQQLTHVLLAAESLMIDEPEGEAKDRLLEIIMNNTKKITVQYRKYAAT